MVYLVFSDSHGATFNMKKVIDAQREKIDGVIFLGDNYKDAEELMSIYPSFDFHAVAGNCDISARFLAPEYCERLVTLGGVKVLMLHGHRQSVKSTLYVLEDYAKNRGADVVLFGHTHERCEKYCLDGVKPLIMFNPGSVALPREGRPSFGVLTIMDGTALTSHGDVL